jgi:hypothetical protein
MSSIITAICWATAIFAVALAGRAELIPSQSAPTLTIVLPALAVVTMFKSRGCTMASLKKDRA